MKKILLLFFLLLGFYSSTAQVISGYVYDELEKRPLEGVFVYFDGTAVSTKTDDKGFFEVKTTGLINTLLVVNAMGYERYLIENAFSVASPLSIYLKENAIKIEEVVINAKQFFTRKQLLRAFKDNFLGQTANGSSCEIENEKDIILSYDVSENLLTAHAVNPLVIINKRLGYRIVFDLAEFSAYYKMRSIKNIDLNSSFYAGTTAFIDISGKDDAGEKRKKAYLGSPTHFLRTVALDEWEKEGFVLYYDRIPASPKQFFRITDTLNIKKVEVAFPEVKIPPGLKFESSGSSLSDPKALPSPKSLRNKKITVLRKPNQQSFMTFDKGVLYVDENGLFAPVSEIYFGGYMGLIRVGDMLPADYKYKL